MNSHVRFARRGPVLHCVLSLLALAGVVAVVQSLWREFEETGFDPFERRLTKHSERRVGPDSAFDVEFPDKSANEANRIAEARLGPTFYSTAVAFASKQSAVLDAIGVLAEVRPAKGENSYHYPFTDGDGGGVVTLRMTGDKGVIVVSVSGHGPYCGSPYINTIAVKLLGAGADTGEPMQALPIRLLDAAEEAEYDKKATGYRSYYSEARQLEQAGEVAKAEASWRQYVAYTEREMDDKNIAAMKHQIRYEYKSRKAWSPPEVVGAMEHLAEFYKKQKQPEKQQKILEQLIPLDKGLNPEEVTNTTEYLRQLAESCEKSGNLKSAVDYMSQELELQKIKHKWCKKCVARRRHKIEKLRSQLKESRASQTQKSAAKH